MALIEALINDQHDKECRKEMWIDYNASLFQHIGTHSSLKVNIFHNKDLFILSVEIRSHLNHLKGRSKLSVYKQTKTIYSLVIEVFILTII